MRKPVKRRLIALKEINDAFKKAMDYCYLFGLPWQEHIITIYNNGHVNGYYVLDETKSTAIIKIIIDNGTANSTTQRGRATHLA